MRNTVWENMAKVHPHVGLIWLSWFCFQFVDDNNTTLFYFSNRRSCRCINSCCTAHREAMGRHNTCGALEHIIQPKPLCITGYRKLPTTCCFEHPGVQPSQYDFHILPIFLLPAHWTVHFLPVWSKSLIGRIWADKQCYSFHFQQL